ncbi:MAG: hypothetical protein RR454_02615, partial [Clostridia bacterium]
SNYSVSLSKKDLDIAERSDGYVALHQLDTFHVGFTVAGEYNFKHNKEGYDFTAIIETIMRMVMKGIPVPSITDSIRYYMSENNAGNVELSLEANIGVIMPSNLENLNFAKLFDLNRLQGKLNIVLNGKQLISIFVNTKNQEIFLNIPWLKDTTGQGLKLSISNFNLDEIVKTGKLPFGLNMADTPAAALKCGCTNPECVTAGSCFTPEGVRRESCPDEHCNKSCFNIIDFVISVLRNVEFEEHGLAINFDNNTLVRALGGLLGIKFGEEITPPFNSLNPRISINFEKPLSIALNMEIFSLKMQIDSIGTTSKNIEFDTTGYKSINELECISIDTTLSLGYEMFQKENLNIGGIVKAILDKVGVTGLDDLTNKKFSFLDNAAGSFIINIKANVNIFNIKNTEGVVTISMHDSATGSTTLLLRAYLKGADEALYVDAPLLKLYKLKISGINLANLFGGNGGIIAQAELNTALPALKCGCTNEACIKNGSCYKANGAKVEGCTNHNCNGTCDSRHNMADAIINAIDCINYSKANGIEIKLKGTAIADILNKVLNIDLTNLGLSLPISLNLNVDLEQETIALKLNLGLYQNAEGQQSSVSLGLDGLSAGVGKSKINLKSLDPADNGSYAIYSEYTELVDVSKGNALSLQNLNASMSIDASFLSEHGLTVKLLPILGQILPQFVPDGKNEEEALILKIEQILVQYTIDIKANINIIDFLKSKVYICFTNKTSGKVQTKIYVDLANDAICVDAPIFNVRNIKLTGLIGLIGGGGLAKAPELATAPTTDKIGTITPATNKIIGIILQTVNGINLSKANGIEIKLNSSIIRNMPQLIPQLGTMNLNGVADLIDALNVKLNLNVESGKGVELGAEIVLNDLTNGSKSTLALGVGGIGVGFADKEILTTKELEEFAKYQEFSLNLADKTANRSIEVKVNGLINVDSGELGFDITEKLYQLLNKKLPADLRPSIQLIFDNFKNRALMLNIAGKLNLSNLTDIASIINGAELYISLKTKSDAPGQSTPITLLEAYLNEGVAYIKTDILKSNIGGNSVSTKVKLDISGLLNGEGINSILPSLKTAGSLDDEQANINKTNAIAKTVISMIDSIVLTTPPSYNPDGSSTDGKRQHGVEVNFSGHTLKYIEKLLGKELGLPELSKLKLSIKEQTNGSTTAEPLFKLEVEHALTVEENVSQVIGTQTIAGRLELDDLYLTIPEPNAKVSTIKPADLITADYADFSKMTGIYAQLGVDLSINAQDNPQVNVSKIFGNASMDVNGKNVLKTISDILSKIFVSLNLTSKGLHGDYRVEIKGLLDSLDFSNFDLSTINAEVFIGKRAYGDKNAPYSTVVSIALHNGIAYFDLTNLEYLKVGAQSVPKFYVDINKILERFNVGAKKALATGLNTADVPLTERDPMDFLAILGKLIFGNDKLVINAATDVIQRVLNSMGISLTDLQSLYAAIDFIKPEIGLGIHFNDKLGVDVALNDIGLIVFDKEHDSSAVKGEFKPTNANTYLNLFDMKVEIGAAISLNMKALRKVYDFSDGLKALLGDVGLKMFVNTNLSTDGGADGTNPELLDKEIKLNIKGNIAIGDILRTDTNYQSRLQITAQISQYDPITITTDLKTIYADLTALQLPKMKIDLDIVKAITGLIKNVGTNGDIFEKPSYDHDETVTKLGCGCTNPDCIANGSCYDADGKLLPTHKHCDESCKKKLSCGCTNPECVKNKSCVDTCAYKLSGQCDGTCNIIGMLPAIIKEVIIGNTKSSIFLNGNALNTIFKLAGLNIALPSMDVLELSFNHDNNGGNVDALPRLEYSKLEIKAINYIGTGANKKEELFINVGIVDIKFGINNSTTQDILSDEIKAKYVDYKDIKIKANLTAEVTFTSK